jgi:hypothetical protein
MSAHSPKSHAHGGDYHGSAAHVDNPDVTHEHDDINVRAIISFIVFLSVVAVVIHLAMGAMFKGLEWYERKNEPYVTPLAEAAGRRPPDPQLQQTPWRDYREFQAEQHNYLHSYGWVDEKLGVARIPIAKAKEMMLQRGLPVRPELAQDLEGTHVFATGDASGGRSLSAGAPDRSAPSSGATPATTPAPAAAPKPGGGQ